LGQGLKLLLTVNVKICTFRCFTFHHRFIMSLTNHEIALELVKLISSDLRAMYQPIDSHKKSKPEDMTAYAEFLAGIFTCIHAKLPLQDATPAQPK